MRRDKGVDKNKEIEARFLVCGDGWRGKGKPEKIIQGYLSTNMDRAVRIRIKGRKAILTIKGKREGLIRKEFEFLLDDLNKAREVIINFCKYPIEKTRHKIQVREFLWEVDEFEGVNKGLVVAEVEFKRVADYKKMLAEGKPDWVGKEITEGHEHYTNVRLAEKPFTLWTSEERKQHALACSLRGHVYKI